MTFKFITLNLWYGGRLFNKILNFFEKERPDILALQEVYAGKEPSLERNFRTLSVFKKELDLKYVAFAPAFTDNREEGKIVQGNAIFSRFPITASQTVFYDIPYNENYIEKEENFPYIPRNLQHVLIQVKDKELNIFNTHGIWGYDGKDNERRLRMSETIVKNIKDKENVLLAGDFNLKENTQTIKNIERHLTNIFKGELANTFNLKRKTDSGFATAVVDMVFASKNLRVVAHDCPQVDISDHLPLVCILEI